MSVGGWGVRGQAIALSYADIYIEFIPRDTKVLNQLQKETQEFVERQRQLLQKKEIEAPASVSEANI